MAENINNVINVFKNLTKGLVHNTAAQLNEKLLDTLNLKEPTSLDLNLINDPGFYFISTNYKYKNLPGYDNGEGKWSNSLGGLLLVFSDTKFVQEDDLNYRFVQIFFKITTTDDLATSAFIRRKAKYQIETANSASSSKRKSKTKNSNNTEADTEIEIAWTKWRSFPDQNDFFSKQGTIESNFLDENKKPTILTDLNNINAPGIYFLSAELDYVNAPLERSSGLLLVYNDLKADDEPTIDEEAADTRLYQMLIVNGNSIYTRWKINNALGFTSWVSFATNESTQNKIDKYHGLEKYDILTYQSGNLFDGNWVTGKRIVRVSEAENAYFRLEPDNNACFLGIVACKPNTTYTIIHANPIKEPSQVGEAEENYFKVTTASHLLTDYEYFSSAVDGIAKNNKLFANIMTNSSDRFIYIQGGYKSENFKEALGPYIKVVEGNCTELEGEYNSSSYGADKATFKLINDLAPKLETNISNTTIVTGGAAKQNLFNGFFCEGLWLEEPDNSSGLKLTYDTNYKGTLIVGVEANTVYSIIKEPTGLENFGNDNFYSVLKVAQTENDLATLLSAYDSGSKTTVAEAVTNVTIYQGSNDNNANNTATTSDPEHPYQFSTTNAAVTHCTIKTGSKTRYLIVSVGKELQPLVQIVKGEQTALTVDSYEELNGLNHSTGRVDSTRRARGQLNFYKWYDKNPHTGNYNCPYMVITNGRNTYTFLYDSYTDDNNEAMGTWRWYNHKIDGGVRWTAEESECKDNQYTENCTCLWNETDSEGAIKIKDQPDFIGGFHKGEKITKITVLIDGRKIEANNADDVEKNFNKEVFIKHGCKNITFIIGSTLTLHESTNDIATGTVIFNRTKKIEITHTKVKVSNIWTATEDAEGLVVERSALAGLYSIRKNFLNGYSDNVTKQFYPATRKTVGVGYIANGLNDSPLRDEVTFYGNKDFVLTVRSLTDKYQYESQWDNVSNEKIVPNYRGSVTDFDDGNDHQDKYDVYFNDMSTELELTKDSIFTGCFEIETLTDDLNFIENV